MDQRAPEPPPPVGRRNPQADAIAPDGSEVRLLIDQRHQATRASLCEVTLAGGQVSRPVWHQRVEEVWYVLEGQGQVWRRPPGAEAASVAPVFVGPGDALAIPKGWRFQFSAGGNGALRFLCYTTPPWPGPEEAQPAEHGGLGEATV
jgi:mannose-6-phosphate isomerase-like protein (cupin superfamily)